jgi:hypothetical protein
VLTYNFMIGVHQVQVVDIAIELITTNVIKAPPTGVDELCALKHGGKKIDLHASA